MQINRRAVMRGAGAVTVLAAGQLRATDTAPAPKLPIEVFANKPSMADLVLSPDGDTILARTQVNGAEMLGTYSIETRRFQNYALPKGADLRWFRWAGPDRILVSIIVRINVSSDQLHVEGRVSRLIVFDLKTQTPRVIGPREGGGASGDDVVYVDPAGSYLLLAIARHSFLRPPDVLKFDLATGEYTTVTWDQPGVFAYFSDDKGVIRAARGQIGDKWFVLYRPDGTSRFKELESGQIELFHPDPFKSMSFVSGSEQGYVLADSGNGRIAAYSYDFAKKVRGEQLFSSATNDVDDLLFDDAGRKLLGVAYTDERYRVFWIDPMLQELQVGMDRSLPDRHNRILSWSDDRERILVYSGATHERGRYYIFQPNNGRMSLLLDLAQGQPGGMAPMRAVKYPARDGLEIPAFLTLPNGRKAEKLPLVIMPHGGPFGIRDRLAFDPEVQMLANRGYAVLQPNYRGSGGYGIEFLTRGEGEWGRKMQDDLDDGMDWLVGRGIVDPKRVCLVGSSYGGYAAAWGATRNPERYRCAACFAGVFDLDAQLSYHTEFLGKSLAQSYRRSLKGSAHVSLGTVSPLQQAERLQAPVLLVHGEEDSTVLVEQSRAYHAALSQHQKPHEFYAIPNEGHGFTQKGSFVFYLSKLDAFLAAHNAA